MIYVSNIADWCGYLELHKLPKHNTSQIAQHFINTSSSSITALNKLITLGIVYMKQTQWIG